MEKLNNLKAVVIGVGRMGRRHMTVLKNLGIAIVAVCDMSRESLNAAKTEGGLSDEMLYTDAGKMLEKARPAVVVIATTADTHCDYVCMAARNGARYILCEKPMAVSLKQCDTMMSVCAEHGAALAINHQMRFMEQYTEPKRIVNSPEFGGLSSVTVVAGNFGMAMNGTHYFEMFRYITDEPPVEVIAWFDKEALQNPRGPQFMDKSGSVRLATKSGKRYYMDIGGDQGHGMQVVYAGRYGKLVIDELAGTMNLAVREAEHRGLPTSRYGMPWRETATKITPADAVMPTQHVLSALLRGENYPGGVEGRLAVQTLVAAYCSDEGGHAAVRMDSPLPLDRVFPWA